MAALARIRSVNLAHGARARGKNGSLPLNKTSKLRKRSFVGTICQCRDFRPGAEVIGNKDVSPGLAGIGADCQKRIVAAGLGFEPRQADSESAVLPLHNPAFGMRQGFGTP